MPEYNEKLRFVTLYAKNSMLGSGQKWWHRVYPVSVYWLILIFLVTKSTVSHDNCSSS